MTGWGLINPSRPDRLFHRSDLVLLEFAVGQGISPSAQRLTGELDAEAVQRHTSAQPFIELLEFLRLTQRTESRGEILERNVIEIEIGVVGEERAVDLAFLQPMED